MNWKTPLTAAALGAILLGSLAAAQSSSVNSSEAQAPSVSGEFTGWIDAREARPNAFALPENRGAAGLELALRRLNTTASVMMITAHPDDEDAPLLTYLARGLGARVTLFTLTRGEGGQNAMSADAYDALGLIRAQEQLQADEYYGVEQLWGTEADFGFSKTQEESFAQWTHERVLYDAVLAVRRERPQVIVGVFVGGPSDGHGHHQVAGEIAQEVFRAAADPSVFPEQLQNGLESWQALAVYSLVPSAPIKDGKIFDYATGKWAPARFKNYLTGAWIDGELPTDVVVEEGGLDQAVGLSYAQIALEGYGQHRSQYGGGNPGLRGSVSSRLHLWAVAPEAAAKPGAKTANNDLFHNDKVEIDTTLAAEALRANASVPDELVSKLRAVDEAIAQIQPQPACADQAHRIAEAYRKTIELTDAISEDNDDNRTKTRLQQAQGRKLADFQSALESSLGLDLTAYVANSGAAKNGEGWRGLSPLESAASAHPGQRLSIDVRTASSADATKLTRVWLKSKDRANWELLEQNTPQREPGQRLFEAVVPNDAPPSAPYFQRDDIAQPFYEMNRSGERERSFSPYPLEAWAEFAFEGLPVSIGRAVQTMQRTPGLGGVSAPLVTAPLLGLHIDPEARLLPLDGSGFPLRVVVHAEAATEGVIELKLPAGWRAEPAHTNFRAAKAGDLAPLLFTITPATTPEGAAAIQAIAHSGGREYSSGWRAVGYASLPTYNLYRPAELKTRKVDAKVAPGLRIGYIDGSGDYVAEALTELGSTPKPLTPTELATTDLSRFDTIVVGVRAYSAHPELAAAQSRLNEFVRNGGTLVVQYQTSEFPAPLPLDLGGRLSEKVVDERAPVKLLAPADPLLNWPNTIRETDFDGWVEERGHSFAKSWDTGYAALTETADPDQEPQRGGLLVAHIGKGAYIYVAFALHRQLPELVPGAYRLLANLVSAGRNSGNTPDSAGAKREASCTLLHARNCFRTKPRN